MSSAPVRALHAILSDHISDKSVEKGGYGK